MIELEIFNKAIREVLLLAGKNPPKEQMFAIYEKIKNYDVSDFINAVNDDELIDGWSINVNYPILRKVIEKHMFNRLEQEERERKKKEREMLEEVIRNNSIPEFVRDFLMRIKTL